MTSTARVWEKIPPNDLTAAQRAGRLVLRFLQRWETAQSSAYGRESYTVTPWGQTITLATTPVVSRQRLITSGGESEPLPSIVLHNLMGSQAMTIGLLHALDLAVSIRSLEGYREAIAGLTQPIIHTDTWGFDTTRMYTALYRNGQPVRFPIVLFDPMLSAMLDAIYAPTWRKRYESSTSRRRREGKAPWPVK